MSRMNGLSPIDSFSQIIRVFPQHLVHLCSPGFHSFCAARFEPPRLEGQKWHQRFTILCAPCCPGSFVVQFSVLHAPSAFLYKFTLLPAFQSYEAARGSRLCCDRSVRRGRRWFCHDEKAGEARHQNPRARAHRHFLCCVLFQEKTFSQPIVGRAPLRRCGRVLSAIRHVRIPPI